MANQPGGILGSGGSAGRRRRRRRRRLPDVLTPADVAKALGVTEADVLATLETGDLKGRKIGSAWRVTTRRARRVPEALVAEVPPPIPGAPPPLPAEPAAPSGGLGARQAPLPRLRRRGALERRRSRRSSARTAAPCRRRSWPATARSSRSTTWRWRCARFPTPAAAGSATARRCSVRAARRSRSSSPPASPSAASSAARRRSCPTPTTRNAIYPGEPAALHGQRGAGARVDPAAGTPAAGSRPTG